MSVLSPREASIFACVVDTLLAPVPPLPPVHATDAVASLNASLLRAPWANRLLLRGVLLTLEAMPLLTGAHVRWRQLAPAQRLAVLERLERRGGRSVVEALRAAAALSYYGDAGVAALLGYTPGALR